MLVESRALSEMPVVTVSTEMPSKPLIILHNDSEKSSLFLF